MPADEYWNGEPQLAKAYLEAHKIKSERENGDAWWQGYYILQAMRSALSASLPWFKRKPLEYPKKPYRVTPLTEAEKAEARKKEQEKAIRRLNALKDAWDRKNGK